MSRLFYAVLLVFTLVQGQTLAAPLSSIEETILEFIESHSEEIAEFKEIINTLINNEFEHRQINQQLNAFKNQLTLVGSQGNECANQLLLKLNKDEPECPSADDVVQASGKIVESTTEIITGSVHSFYIIFNSETVCPDLDGFRCFLSRYHKVKGAVFQVLDNLTEYTGNIKKLIDVYQHYFGECKSQKKSLLQLHQQLFTTCNNKS